MSDGKTDRKNLTASLADVDDLRAEMSRNHDSRYTAPNAMPDELNRLRERVTELERQKADIEPMYIKLRDWVDTLERLRARVDGLERERNGDET